MYWHMKKCLRCPPDRNTLSLSQRYLVLSALKKMSNIWTWSEHLNFLRRKNRQIYSKLAHSFHTVCKYPVLTSAFFSASAFPFLLYKTSFRRCPTESDRTHPLVVSRPLLSLRRLCMIQVPQLWMNPDLSLNWSLWCRVRLWYLISRGRHPIHCPCDRRHCLQQIIAVLNEKLSFRDL